MSTRHSQPDQPVYTSSGGSRHPEESLEADDDDIDSRSGVGRSSEGE